MSELPKTIGTGELVALIDSLVPGTRVPDGPAYEWVGDDWTLTLTPHGDEPCVVLRTVTRRGRFPFRVSPRDGRVLEVSVVANLVLVNGILSRMLDARTRGIQPHEARDAHGQPVVAYGPCCLSPDLCTCRRYGARIRALGFHPVASTRRRDLVCLTLGRDPGSLVPVTCGDGVIEMWDPAAPWEGDLSHARCAWSIPIENWGRIGDLVSDSRYRFQPDSEPDDYALKMGRIRAALLEPSTARPGSPQAIAAAACLAGALATRIDRDGPSAITLTVVVDGCVDQVVHAAQAACPTTTAMRIVVLPTSGDPVEVVGRAFGGDRQ